LENLKVLIHGFNTNNLRISKNDASSDRNVKNTKPNRANSYTESGIHFSSDSIASRTREGGRVDRDLITGKGQKLIFSHSS
jgi:hypothetical protein